MRIETRTDADARTHARAMWREQLGRLLGGARRALGGRATAGVAVAGLAFVIVAGVGALLLTGPLRDGFRLWMDEAGYGVYAAYETPRRLPELVEAPLRMARAPDAPKLVLDVPFENWERIRVKRNEALAAGVLVVDDGDDVNARLRTSEGETRVRIRLKGDWLDHLKGEKWSLRVETRGGDAVFGMRRFSLQAPATRGYQGQALVFEALRRADILAPRWFYAEVIVNGDSMGLMEVEEHFSKELLEAQNRREAPIIRFDESLMWTRTDQWSGFSQWFGPFNPFASLDSPYNSWLNVPIDTFGSGAVMKDPVAAERARGGMALLRGVVDGTLKPSDAFDVARMGRFLAVAELFSAHHMLRWHNLRFYVNPITGRLEPIGFDGDPNEFLAPGWQTTPNEPTFAAILSDDVIFAAFRESLAAIVRDVREGDLIARLRAIDAAAVETLRGEFPFLQNFPFDRLTAQANWISARLESNAEAFRAPYVYPRAYPTLAHAWMLPAEQGAPAELEVRNGVPHDVEIVAIRWMRRDGALGPAFASLAPVVYPVRLPPTPYLGSATPLRIAYRPPEAAEDLRLEVVTKVAGMDDSADQRYVSTALAYVRPATGPLQPVGAAEFALGYPFFVSDAGPDTLTIRPGVWMVDGDLLSPPGVTVRAGPGVTLLFEKDAAFVARGPLRFEGAEDQPVTLAGRPTSDGSRADWQGLVVMSPGAPSNLTHVQIRETTGVSRPGMRLTGGATFYEADITLDGVVFDGSHGEDALNIVRAHFEMRDVAFHNTASDAFDSDFSSGSVTGGSFEAVGYKGGGDGIDISGADVRVAGVSFRDVSDKALSVGERSQMTATGLRIEDVGAGAAVKDSSTLVITDSEIVSPRVAGLLAYTKKPEFRGPSRITATGLTITGAPHPTMIQTGAELLMDGVAVATRDIDVDALYETVMRKAGR